MGFSENTCGKLLYLTADNLPAEYVSHAFTTKLGGVSEGCYASLNLGISRGDDINKVRANYEILGRALGFSPKSVIGAKQIHSDIIRKATRADCGKGLYSGEMDYECDALITNEPGLPLMVFTADCTPILLFDPVHRAIAAVHSGWRGTARGIVSKAVSEMAYSYGSIPGDILAAIGPCVGKCCYEVGGEVIDAMTSALGSVASAHFQNIGASWHIDLKGLNHLWLSNSGLTDENIEISDECTACDSVRFYSHRISGNNRGNLAAVIMLKAAC